MQYITNDQYGIADKETYKAVVQAINKNPLLPMFLKRINTRDTHHCRELTLTSSEYKIENLDFLLYFPNLIDLFVISERLHDISPLSQAVNLDLIILENMHLNTLAPISACRHVTCVALKNVKVEDEDFRPLGQLACLNALTLEECNVTDIRWIAGHSKLEVLELDNNPIGDYSPIGTVPNLKSICVNERTSL